MSRIEVSAFSTSKHRLMIHCIVSERDQISPQGLGDQNHTGAIAFAENGHLSAMSSRLQVLPIQTTEF
jgi:hypothetical protein